MTLTEQESRQIEKKFEKYAETTDITVAGLQDIVIKYEEVMYVFSAKGDVLVMDGGEVGMPCA